MELIEEIQTLKGKKLQLLRGDLTRIPESHKIDVLVVSAFANDYVATASSLIGALHASGLSVDNLAADKESDLRSHFSCWLSKEVNFHHIKRILCFEPIDRDNPYELIAGIFQSLMPFTLTHSLSTVAMPLVLTGDQGYANEQVIKELIHTSLFWLNNDSSLQTIKIVERDAYKIELIKSAFQKQPTSGGQPSDKAFDFFISYSRKDETLANIIQETLSQQFKIFFDTESIGIGANWLTKINTSLEKSRRFIVCVSPDYLDSKMCKYEYAFCNLKFIEDGDDYVLPIYLYSSSLPFQMKILNYYDAREGKSGRVEEFCNFLITKYTQ